MAKPMMIQEEDAEKIEKLKNQLGSKTKIEVVRRALQLLELEVRRGERIKRWQKSAKAVGASGLSVLQDFQHSSRFKNIDS